MPTDEQISQATLKQQHRLRHAKTVDPDAHLNNQLLSVHFNRTVRTIDRWKQDPKLKFPKPDLVINGREYWRRRTIERWEATQAPTADEAA
jgi:hypothetical protein